MRYDETYPFGGIWYLWGKLVAKRGWRISFSDRTFVWHHNWLDGTAPYDGRLEDPRQLQQQLLATTYVQFVNALWVDRSAALVFWAVAHLVRRLVVPSSIIHFKIRTRLPLSGSMQAVWRAIRAGRVYLPV